MKTTIYNKVKRIAMLALVGSMASISMQAQEALHLFYKDGTHNKIAITENTEIEFVKQPYVEVIYSSMEDNTIHIWANAGRTIDYGWVKSNMPWTASTDVDWLRVRYDKLDQYKGLAGEGMKETAFRIFAEANKTGEERTATVTITPTRGEAKTFTVVQHPAILSLEPIGESYGLEPVTSQEVTIAWNNTEYYADAYPNFGVKVLSKPSWMTLDSTVNNENFTLEKVDKIPDDVQVTWEENLGYFATYGCFSFEENRTPKSRTGNIIFESNGETVVLTITQEGLTDATTLASLENLQQKMIQFGVTSTSHDDFSHMSVLHATDMMSEDMTMFNSSWFNFDYEHSFNAPTYRRNNANWQTYYGIVNLANSAIDLALDVQNEVSNANFVLGNAYAYRAMAYLYLIQLFQDPTSKLGVNTSLPGVPMIYTETEKAQMSKEQIEYFKGRNTVGEVFAQIEADITRAIELLQGEVRPSKNYIDITVAQGIAARYYLLAQEWQKAATMANAARNSYRLMDGNTESNGIRDGFMDITNEEWMWGFDHTPETQTTYASFFSHISNLSPGYSGILYTGRGVDARLFEQMSASDYRRAYWYRDANGNTESTAAASPEASAWQNPYAILKFGWKEDWTQDYIYMRAAEMVLIEAEAYTHIGWSTDAANALSELMVRRDPNWEYQYPTLEDIYLQRRLELIGEGHAYFDLKRLNKGIERNYEGNNHLEGYAINVTENDSSWIYKIPQNAINNDYIYNLTEEDNLWISEPVYLKEVNYTQYYTGDTIFMSASAGRAYTYGRVECNYPWTVSSDAEWLLTRINESDIYDDAFSGEYAYENIFMIYAQANNTDKERTAKVTIATAQNVKKTFTVVQRPHTLSFNEQDYINNGRYDGEPVDTFLIEATWDWSYAYFNLIPNWGWKVTSYPDWMTLDEFKHSIEDINFESILAEEDILAAGQPIVSTAIFSFEPNESANERIGVITFEGKGKKAVGILHQEGLNEQTINNAAYSMLKGMYQFGEGTSGSRHNDFGFPSLMFTMDSRGTDLVSEYSGYNWFTHALQYSDINSSYYYTSMYWNTMYNQIQAANEVIGAYKGREGESFFDFYLGQAYTLRAFSYFYLAQLYQHTYVGNEEQPCVPVIHEGNMNTVYNEGCSRASVREVYDFIIKDLDQALQLLQQSEMKRTNKQFASPEVVYGLRARIYMVMNRWEEAAANAQRVIEAGIASPYTKDEVSRPTFADINHNAWIWGIDTQEEDPVVTSGIINWPSHMGTFSYGYAQVGTWRKMSKSLYNAIPSTDVRKGWFLSQDCTSANLNEEQANYIANYSVPAYTQVKFAPYNDELGTYTNANDIPLIRIEEMFLILAEAQAMTGKTAEATKTLNSFVSTYRDPAYNCTATTAEAIQDAVWMQRRIELWGEGHSYFDLMRMNKGVDRRGAGFQEPYIFNIPAGDAALIYPIPDREMNSNVQLIQNPVAEQPVAVAENTREWLGTGTYIYSCAFSTPQTDAGLNFYKDNTMENAYVIENWFYGVDFTFTWDGGTNVKVLNQYTGYNHSTYGEMYVMELSDYAGQTMSPSYFDPETGTFYFGVIYYVEAGNFGYGYETFTLDEVEYPTAHRAPSADKAGRQLPLDLKLQTGAIDKSDIK